MESEEDTRITVNLLDHIVSQKLEPAVPKVAAWSHGLNNIIPSLNETSPAMCFQ